MTEKTTPIQVDESEKLTIEEEGEQMQDWELAQQIEKINEVTNMEVGDEPHNEDTDLMLRSPEVKYQSPPTLVSKPVPSEQGQVVLFDDDSVMDVYNISFDELQKKIIQA